MKNNLPWIAIIGCGRIAGHHCRSIVAEKRVGLAAVCDLDAAKAEAYGAEFGVTAYTNYRRMLEENPQISIVAVATPSGMHFEHGMDLIENYGKSLIVEKPTFLRTAHLEQAYDAAEARGLSIFPVFQNRHNLAVQRVKRGLEDGELGEVRLVAVRVRWCRPDRYYNLAPWRGTYALDGGCLTNQGIHHVDLIRYFGGEVERVASLMKTLGATVEVETAVVASASFASGAVGALEVTTAARPIDYEASISLVCENGLAQIGGIAVNELQTYTPDPSACAANSEDFSGNVYGHGHEKLYAELADHFASGRPYSIPRQDALGSIRLLNAYYVADETGRWVDVKSCGDSIRLGCPDENLAQQYRTSP